MEHVPDMPLSTSGFITRTAGLNAEEIAAYMRLLCHMWQNGACLPNDDARIALLLGVEAECWRRMKKVLAPMLEIEGSTITQPYLREQWEKIQASREKSRVKAKQRWVPKEKRNAVAYAAAHAAASPAAHAAAYAKKERKKEKEPKRKKERKNSSVTKVTETPDVSAAPLSGAENADVFVSGKKFVFDEGTRLMMGTGLNEVAARAFLGRLVRDYGDREVEQALRHTLDISPVEPRSFLVRRLQDAAGVSDMLGMEAVFAAQHREAEDAHR